MVKRTRNTNTTKPEITLLNKSILEFKRELSERIELGKNIQKEKIKKDQDFFRVEKELNVWSDYNLELLKQSFNNPYNEYWRSYDDAGSFSGIYVNTLGSRQTSVDRLNKFLSKLGSKIDNLSKLLNKADLLKSTVSGEEVISERSSKLNMSQVFIVHGHDDLAKSETARFIENLGFEPIILHEQASLGRTIIEKIENYSNVGFGIVLYTPCDIGAKNGEENNLKPRARQNVVFEHGFLIGKIGRENVCALVENNIETPNDISGVVYISLQGVTRN